MKVHRKRAREKDVGDFVKRKNKKLDTTPPGERIDQLRAIWYAAVADSVGISNKRSSCRTGNWVPNRHYKAFFQTSNKDSAHSSTSTPTCTFDRYDLAGTSEINELVLKHMAMKERDPVIHANRFKRIASPDKREPVMFKLNAYCFNFVRSLVHPLHNFLQYHYDLHNADELEVMLMPCKGPLAEADARYHCHLGCKTPTGRKGGSTTRAIELGLQQRAVRSGDASLKGRHCYVATNNETLSDDNLAAAVRNWGVSRVFGISAFTMLRTGAIGRHAEQKLLEFLFSEILPHAAPEFLLSSRKENLLPMEKALVIGERLPCAVCKLFARRYEPYAQMLPSHGHLYLSTVCTTLSFDSSLEELLLSPASAASILMEKGSGRCLMH
ncbi:unnamed protein product [Phytomonas sp. EM1]|nr:unnamed protein product [Phytomonas sp. EM1]|eukprot:CCW59665.1 unnamed protein product [Phytomonas sp. isolate EM1]